MRVQRWVETYRAQLDRLQLYAARAMFDAARGRRARAAFEQARLAGRNAEAKEVAGAMRRTAPPQIVVRCQFCATNIAPSKGAGMLGELNEAGRGAGAQLGVKVRLQLVLLSPSLRLGAGELTFLSLSLPAVDALPVVQQAGPGVLHLPRATVAALVRRSRSCVSLSLSSLLFSSSSRRAELTIYDPLRAAATLCWCQRCRHGGHASHLLAWFESASSLFSLLLLLLSRSSSRS